MDSDYAGYRTNDTPAETAERIVESIRRGMADALGELVLSPDELVVAAGMAALDANTKGYFGKTLLLLLLGFTVKDMYDATVEPINRHERARRYTKDAVILLVTALSEQYVEKAAEKVSEKLCDTKFVRGFTDFVMDTEISDRKTLAKVFFAESDTEVFQAVSNYLDEEALSYLTAEIGNHADLKARDVAKVVLKCAQKNDDTPIDLEDARFILREMAGGTEESVIVRLFKGSGETSKISLEIQKKILMGKRKSPTKNVIIGGHSPQINNTNDLFVVEEISVNADGTKNIKFVKDLQDGTISKIKRSTIFPDSWSDSKIINSIKEVGDSPSIW